MTRYSIYPVRHKAIFDCYKKQEGHLWTSSIVDLAKDVVALHKLGSVPRDVYMRIFAIFNVLDTVVDDNNCEIEEDVHSIIDNINESVIAQLKYDRYDIQGHDHIEAKETKYDMVMRASKIYNRYTNDGVLELMDKHELLELEWYIDAAKFIERIHSDCYSQIIEQLVPDIEERRRLQDAASNFDFVRRKIDVFSRYSNTNNITLKILCNACAELIGFSGLFAPVIFLKGCKRDYDFTNLTYLNEEVIVDESIHGTSWVSILLSLMREGFIPEMSLDKIKEIVLDFSRSEIDAVDDIISEDASKDAFFKNVLTNKNLKQYIMHITDFALSLFGITAHYKVSNPLDFMDSTSFITKSNFHEKKSGEYTTSVDGKNVAIRVNRFRVPTS